MGDLRSASVVGGMVVLSVMLGYIQEARSSRAIETLLSMIKATCIRCQSGFGDVETGYLCGGNETFASFKAEPGMTERGKCRSIALNQTEPQFSHGIWMWRVAESRNAGIWKDL